MSAYCRGGSGGGGGLGGLGGHDPLSPLWGTPKLHKEEKTLLKSARMQHILVVNSCQYPPLSEIL